MNLLDRRGQVIPKKPIAFNPPPENKNFKADFEIKVPRGVLKSAPYMFTVMGSIAPGITSVIIAVQLKFRNGTVVSGGPLKMEIKQDDEENENGSDPVGDAPGSPGSDPDLGV